MTKVKSEVKVFEKVISTEDGRKLIFPNISSLMSTHQVPGELISLPVNVKDKPAFWEQGGRHPDYEIARGTVVSGANDRLLPIITVNKRSRKPNGLQALMPLGNNGKVFVGRMNVPKHYPSIRLKIFELIFKSYEPSDVESIGYGIFEVGRCFSNYGDIGDCIPAKMLADKLFTKNVLRPFYGNGWSVSNIDEVDMDWAIELSKKIINSSDIVKFDQSDQFILEVENSLIEIENPGLSSALQIFDLNEGISMMIPLKGLKMGDIENTYKNVNINGIFSIDIDELLTSYNHALTLDTSDRKTFEIVVSKDNGRFTRKISDGVYCCLRGWKG